MQEEGKLHILKTRWWKEKRGGGSCRVGFEAIFIMSSLLKIINPQDDTSKSSSAANELGLANVGGVFVVLMGGMVIITFENNLMDFVNFPKITGNCMCHCGLRVRVEVQKGGS